nr:DUF488 family protein [Ornithinibacillus halotolerans]
MIKSKRIYEAYSSDDGIRILVDRLWPRGISKEKAKLGFWLKEVAPSNELRKWYNHDLNKFEEFKERYISELKVGLQYEALTELKQIIINTSGTVTLLYGAKEETFNQTFVLMELLKK